METVGTFPKAKVTPSRHEALYRLVAALGSGVPCL